MMNTKNKFLIAILMLFVVPLGIYGQRDDKSYEQHQKNQERYWFYRDRLKYFVKPDGSSMGGSCIAGCRNEWGGETLKWGQHNMHFGRYLAMLATEFKLLRHYGFDSDANNTLNELEQALLSYIRRDECEANPPWDYLGILSKYDGFFIRDDVPGDYLDNNYDHFNQGEVGLHDVNYYISNGQSGYPAKVTNMKSGYSDWDDHDDFIHKTTMSKDEAYGLWFGLAMVDKCVPNGWWAENESETIVHEIFDHMRNASGIVYPPKWLIGYPDPTYCNTSFCMPGYISVNPGTKGCVYLERYGVTKAAEFITGNSYVTFIPYGEAWELWKALPLTVGSTTNPVFNTQMILELAAINDDYDKSTLENLAKEYNWESNFMLYWKVLHDKEKDCNNPTNEAYNQLSNAPNCGPYNYNSHHAPNGWASGNRFTQSIDGQNGNGTRKGNWHGLDYMLLYNLFHLRQIMENEDMPQYTNFVDRKIIDEVFPYTFNDEIIGSHDNPLTMQAIETIETDMEVTTNGDVELIASSNIKFLPGFKAENGADFKATCTEYDCSAGSKNSLYSDKSFYTAYDEAKKSLILDVGDCKLVDDEPIEFNGDYKENEDDSEYTQSGFTTFNTSDNVENTSMVIYPVPAKTHIFVDFANCNIVQRIEVKDQFGKSVATISNIQNKNRIDLSNLSNGIYFIHVYKKNDVLVEKIIKH